MALYCCSVVVVAVDPVRRSDGSRLSYLARDGGEPPTYRPRPELGPSSIVSTCSHAACNPRTDPNLTHR